VTFASAGGDFAADTMPYAVGWNWGPGQLPRAPRLCVM
jgi:hypothetical protein